MSDVSAIEWTDATWNPVTGCSRVSPGCANCYIERTPPFRMQGRRFEVVGQESTTGVTLHPDRLDKPLRWRKPRRVFVCSLADLFHDDVGFGYLVQVFSTMRRASEHTFQVLTKRPERMAQFISLWRSTHPDVEPNVWLGVSIENARYTWRADVLREIPAAVRFISAEPLLGSLFTTTPAPLSGRDHVTGLASGVSEGRAPTRERASLDLTGIDWVIIGGESGPGARPFHLEHAREIIRVCRDHDVASFVKQLGASPLATWEVDGHPCSCRQFGIRDRKGGDIIEWPADLQIREFPETRVAA